MTIKRNIKYLSELNQFKIFIQSNYKKFDCFPTKITHFMIDNCNQRGNTTRFITGFSINIQTIYKWNYCCNRTGECRRHNQASRYFLMSDDCDDTFFCVRCMEDKLIANPIVTI